MGFFWLQILLFVSFVRPFLACTPYSICNKIRCCYVKAMRQNYHLYIHKKLAQLSLHVEAQPSTADFKREFS